MPDRRQRQLPLRPGMVRLSNHRVAAPLSSVRAGRALAEDLLDWDRQFGGPPDAECLVAGDDFARWVQLARKVVGDR